MRVWVVLLCSTERYMFLTLAGDMGARDYDLG